MSTLKAIRIDDPTWDSVSRERRREWRQALDEIVETHRFDVGAPEFALDVRYAPDGVHLVARDGAGSSLAEARIPHAEVSQHFDEYLDICRKMGKLGGNPQAPQLEAFDIAKRIAHDEAAETVAALCRGLGVDHATSRRLFTLLVALYYDTTRLVLPHHRR